MGANVEDALLYLDEHINCNNFLHNVETGFTYHEGRQVVDSMINWTQRTTTCFFSWRECALSAVTILKREPAKGAR